MSAKIPDNCLFYQAIELPEIGLISGAWDHRGTVDDYLGQVDFRGHRVLDVGPANGFFTFEMERRGADVTALDLGPEGAWDAVPHPYVDADALIANLRENVHRVENAFWFGHRVLESRAKLVHGSVYSAPSLVEPVEIAFMGNVLQHFRDPFYAIEQVAKVATDTMLVTEAVWDADETFLEAASMRLIPRAELPHVNHSWWQVPPTVVIEILRLLGFPRLSLTYHQQLFVGSASDSSTRWVKHFTVVGTRLGGGGPVLDPSELRVQFADREWYAEESRGSHRWRWSSANRATILVQNVHPAKRVASIGCGVSSLQPDRVECRLNGEVIWCEEFVGLPVPMFVSSVTLNVGENTLEFRGNNAPIDAPGEPRRLGFAVHDVVISADRSGSQV